MGPWMSVLVAYLVGGVTFVPLLLVAVLIHAHYTFPYREDFSSSELQGANGKLITTEEDSIVHDGDDTTGLEAARKGQLASSKDGKDGSSSDEKERNGTAAKEKEKPKAEVDVAAGYFAVCREYTPSGMNAKPIERTTPVGAATVASPSPSVYQTMYRSIFDRKNTTNVGPLDNSKMPGRGKRAGNVFYVVLRHGHLMLFDDDDQLEVRHVISLAHHDISIYSGGDATPEGELFIKRNALCLSRKANDLAPDSVVSKPFYLFSENCSVKENFYFALLKNQEQWFGAESGKAMPTPKTFQVSHMISLVQRLHANEEHIHTRWLNAMIGRLFLAVYQTSDLENYIREKITKKLTRVKTPSFLTNIKIHKIDTGEAGPFFTNLKLKDLTVEGECVVEGDVKYTGNFRIEVTATVKIDLGTRFKAREVNIVLAVVLKKVEGHILFKIKPPPSNRIWFSFEKMPKLDLDIEPIVSTRQITYTLILRQIENRIKEVVQETLVHPFWDDIPFFKTDHKQWRGGIFDGDDAVEISEKPIDVAAEEGNVESVQLMEDSPAPSLKDETSKVVEKSQSLPVIGPLPERTGLFGRKLGKSGIAAAANASSTSLDSKGLPGAATSSPRSPIIVKEIPEPIVGTDSSNAELFKPHSPPKQATDYMTALASMAKDAASPAPTGASTPTGKSSIARTSTPSSSSSKEAQHNESEMEPANTSIDRRSTASSADSFNDPTSMTTSSAKSIKSPTGVIGRNFFRRDQSSIPVATASLNSEQGQNKRNTLAAMTTAAAQARQWGWNAIQRQREARKAAEEAKQVDLSQPMGRGQPLPPLGTPLPGPNGKAMAPSSTVPKRKPVGEGASNVPQTPNGEERPVLPSRSHANSASSDSVDRPRPPLPQRRRRGGSHDVDPLADDAGDDGGLLVVAAPDDSQPSSPIEVDESGGYLGIDMAAGPDDIPVHNRYVSTHSSGSASLERLPSLIPVAEEHASGDDSLADIDMQAPGDDTPIIAIPAVETPPVSREAEDEDEDDGLSGWLDQDVDVAEKLEAKAEPEQRLDTPAQRAARLAMGKT